MFDILEMMFWLFLQLTALNSMGMFDTLYCDYPLLDNEVQHESFQTKDFSCVLDTYRITTDGRLYHEPDNELTDDETLFREADYLDFQGAIKFYTFIERPFEPPLWTFAEGTDEPQGQVAEREWYEYHAMFVGGIVSQIVRTHRRDKHFFVRYEPSHTVSVAADDITDEVVKAALAEDRRLVLPLEKKRFFSQKG
jgi:hypothetical protein